MFHLIRTTRQCSDFYSKKNPRLLGQRILSNVAYTFTIHLQTKLWPVISFYSVNTSDKIISQPDKTFTGASSVSEYIFTKYNPPSRIHT